MSSLTNSFRRIQQCADLGTLTLTDLGENGAIVMLSERDQMLTINPSAAFLLERVLAMKEPIEDPFTSSLSAQLAQRFGISSELAHADLARFFEELEKWL